MDDPEREVWPLEGDDEEGPAGGGIRLQIARFGVTLISDEGKSIRLARSYRTFRQEKGESEFVFHVRGQPGADLLSALEGGPLFDARTWALYPLGPQLLYAAPSPTALEPKQWIVVDQEDRSGAIYLPGGSWPLNPPFGDLTFPVFGLLYARRHGILVHASAVSWEGRALLFPGASTRGKSRMVQRWQELGAHVLDEDRVVVRLWEDKVQVFGTPWHPEPRLHSPAGAPLEKVFFLRQGEAGKVTPCPPALAAARLLESSFLPVFDPQAMATLLDVAGAAVAQARCFDLGYVTDDAILDTLMDL